MSKNNNSSAPDTLWQSWQNKVIALGGSQVSHLSLFDVDKLLQRVNEDPSIYVLDVRSKEEFNVSRLHETAIRIDDSASAEEVMRLLKKPPLDATIVCYCSIGYRSTRLAQRLISAGYLNTFNVQGGLFEWLSSGRSCVNDVGEAVRVVHPYNALFGKLVNKELHDYGESKDAPSECVTV